MLSILFALAARTVTDSRVIFSVIVVAVLPFSVLARPLIRRDEKKLAHYMADFWKTVIGPIHRPCELAIVGPQYKDPKCEGRAMYGENTSNGMARLLLGISTFTGIAYDVLMDLRYYVTRDKSPKNGESFYDFTERLLRSQPRTLILLGRPAANPLTRKLFQEQCLPLVIMRKNLTVGTISMLPSYREGIWVSERCDGGSPIVFLEETKRRCESGLILWSVVQKTRILCLLPHHGEGLLVLVRVLLDSDSANLIKKFRESYSHPVPSKTPRNFTV